MFAAASLWAETHIIPPGGPEGQWDLREAEPLIGIARSIRVPHLTQVTKSVGEEPTADRGLES